MIDNTIILGTKEACQYLGISKSYLYKLTYWKQIPHYKPLGKLIYFNKTELDAWLLSNRVATNRELEERAQNICNRKGGVL